MVFARDDFQLQNEIRDKKKSMSRQVVHKVGRDYRSKQNLLSAFITQLLSHKLQEKVTCSLPRHLWKNV
jgi:hypothetical protein